MKFIIARSTIVAGNAQYDEINKTIANAFGHDVPDAVSNDIVLTDEYENFSAKLTNDEYVFELNDEVILKFMRVYTNAARVIMPLIKPLIAVFDLFKGDVAEVEAFIGKRK